MIRYALGRLLGIVPTLLVIITAAFFVMRLAPGGPFDEEQTLPPEIAANLQAAYGLDQPVHVQFVRYLGGLLRGDLGPSFRLKDFTVVELIGRGLPVTLSIGLAALVLALAVGIPLDLLGRLARVMRNNVIETLLETTLNKVKIKPKKIMFYGLAVQLLIKGNWIV
jgi:oligopeptide transport system permease protein